MKRNLPCELHVGDAIHRAATLEIDAHRLVVQCDANPAAGTEVDVHFPALRDIGEFWLRARVAHRAQQGARDLALLVQEAPPVYQVLGMPGVEIDAGTSAPEPSEAPSEASSAPDAVLLDAGDLAPIARVLDRLEISYERVSARQAQLSGYPAARRLLIVSARLAFRIPLASLANDGEVVGIAVAETTTQTLVRHVQRLGFRYLVSLPFHDEAVELLLRGALFRERDQRGAERRSVGVEVSWRRGVWRRRATLVEISKTGGRLHSAVPVDPGSVLRLSIPGRAGSGKPVQLRGQVVRSERRGDDRAEPHLLALRWEGIDARTGARLAELLAARTLGPVPQAAQVPSGAGEAADAAREGSASSAFATHAAADRRGAARAALAGEAVSLDASDRVEHVFVCRDVSLTGMRIEPHPSLQLGDRVRIALVDPSGSSPILVEAEAVRDGGDAGMGLRFFGVDDGTRNRLGALISGLPALQALQPRPARMVLGRLVGGSGAQPDTAPPARGGLPEREGGA